MLTEREVEVMRLLEQGLSNKEIASQLGIGVHTIGTHVGSIYDKLGVHNRIKAINEWKRIAGER